MLYFFFGGGGSSNTVTTNAMGAGGGAAGGYAEKLFDTSTLADSITVTVGAEGGNPVSGVARGGTGGTSTFASTTPVVANGGTGGYWATNSTGPLGGLGGPASGGDRNIRGSPGCAGHNLSAGKGTSGDGGQGELDGSRGSNVNPTYRPTDNTGSGSAGNGSGVTTGDVRGAAGLVEIWEFA
jgi:hypothetical protein